MLWAPCGICQIWKYVNWIRAYICARISLIKRVSSGPPCCFGVVRLVLSIHDSQQWITPEDRLWLKGQSSYELNETNNQFKGLKGPF